MSLIRTSLQDQEPCLCCVELVQGYALQILCHYNAGTVGGWQRPGYFMDLIRGLILPDNAITRRGADQVDKIFPFSFIRHTNALHRVVPEYAEFRISSNEIA